MAHSLELRSPLLDHRVVELGLSLPDGLKLAGREGKQALRRAFAGDLPPVVAGRGKSGFGVPLARWFRSELREPARELLLGERARERGWFRPEAVERLLGEHERGRADHGHRLWTLVMLELWLRAHVEAPAAVDGVMRVLHVHRMRGIGGSERHLLTLLPALAERGIDVAFVGLDDPAWNPVDFYGALRVPAIRIPAPRDLDPLLLARLATPHASGRRPHASRPRRRLRRPRRDAAARAARLDEAQRRPVPGRPVPPRRARSRPALRPDRHDHRRAAHVHDRAGRDPGGEGRDDPLRHGRPPRAVGREPGRRRPRGCARAARRLAPDAAEGSRRRRARARVAARRHGARRALEHAGGAGEPRAARAASSAWRGGCTSSAASPTWPRGCAAPPCSSIRRGGRGSGSACSRRCSPGCRSWPRTSARCRSSSSTARPGSSSAPTTRPRSRSGSPALSRTGHGSAPPAASAPASEFSVARMADRTAQLYDSL